MNINLPPFKCIIVLPAINRLKVLFVIFIFSFFSDCEKNEYYVPKPECNSDWTTNGQYHRNVFVQPEVKNSPDSFTATIDGKPFKADSGIYATYYKGRTTVAGRNKKFQTGIILNENDVSNADFYLWISDYSGTTPRITEKKINIIDLDPENGTISAEFSARVEVHSFDKVYDGIINIDKGIIRNVRFKNLFCRPAYTFQQKNSGLYGEWNLIEITDCLANKSYYPPCGCSLSISIDSAKRDFSYPYQLYDYDFGFSGGANHYSFTYKLLNDSTIITSGNGGTQVGSTEWILDYDYMFYNLLKNETVKFKTNKNLLEFETTNQVFLRFYR